MASNPNNEASLRVVMDTTVATADRAGVGRYIDEVAASLASLGVSLTLIVHQRDEGHFRGTAPTARLIIVPRIIERRPVRFLWEQFVLPFLVYRSRAQILHSPHYTMPLASPVPVVVTLHDATFFTHPEVHERAKRYFFRFWTRLSLRRAALCVTPSEATKNELVRVAGADAGKVHVTPLGVSTAHFHVPTPEEKIAARKHLSIVGPYIAFLGTLEPRKNVDALISGWVSAALDRPHPPSLVLVGKQGWGDGFERLLDEVPEHLQVIVPGYLPLGLLAGYLGGAEVVAYPSLGEGFGLPVLEAMSCGAAVLTTPRLSLPEVGGDAVAYTEPGAESIAAALGRLLDEPDERDRLRGAAAKRALLFSWSECARLHLQTFHEAVRSCARVGR